MRSRVLYLTLIWLLTALGCTADKEEALRKRFLGLCQTASRQVDPLIGGEAKAPFWMVRMYVDENGVESSAEEFRPVVGRHTFGVLPGTDGYAASRREARTLACVIIRYSFYDSCTYSGAAGGFSVKRLGCQTKAVLIDAESSQVIKGTDWTGTLKPCPDHATSNASLGGFRAGPPSDVEIFDWVRENCNR